MITDLLQFALVTVVVEVFEVLETPVGSEAAVASLPLRSVLGVRPLEIRLKTQALPARIRRHHLFRRSIHFGPNNILIGLSQFHGCVYCFPQLCVFTLSER